MLHAERVALQGIFELHCAEEVYLAVMDSKNPEAVAAGMRLLLTHMHSWSHQMLAGMTLDRMDSETALEVSPVPHARSTARFE